MAKQYNIKIRKCCDYRDWEEIPNEMQPLETSDVFECPADMSFEMVADNLIIVDPIHIYEVRINEVGSPQGFYFQNKSPERLPHTSQEFADSYPVDDAGEIGSWK